MIETKKKSRILKLLAYVLTLAMLLSLVPFTVSAATVASGTCGDNLTWVLDDEGTLTISGEGEISGLVDYSTQPWNEHLDSIKSVVIEPGVTSIGNNAFAGCSSLTGIAIPDGVTRIGNWSFQVCNSLKSIVIPDSVTSIGAYAFEGCFSLESIVIPYGMTSIGEGAFKSCSSLASIEIPDSVTSIGGGAFEGCSSLTGVVIPNSVTWIDYCTFFGCTALTSIVIPDSVTEIFDSAFAGCSSLTGIATPDSVTSIGGGAFSNCSSLTSINIPDRVTSIGDCAFNGCSSLTGIVIPDSVTEIFEFAFAGCSNLTSIAIPDSVTSIDYRTFAGCSSLTGVVIPNSITWIGSRAFYDCPNLSNIYYGGTEEEWKAIDIDDENSEIDSCKIYYNTDHIHSFVNWQIVIKPTKTEFGSEKSKCEYCDEEMTRTVPLLGTVASGTCGKNLAWVLDDEGKLTISGTGELSYYDCPWYYLIEKIKNVVIEDGITGIGNNLFSNHTNLLSIIIPDSVTSIGKHAFDHCESLTSVQIPAGVTRIGEHTFEFCNSLEDVYIPSSVTSIGEFAFSSCENLSTVYYGGTEKEWKAIDIGYGNTCLENAIKIFNASIHSHSFGEWTVTTEPTCTENGLETRKCESCDAAESREIAALGHTETVDTALGATCTTDGLTEGRHCSICGEILAAQEVIPALGHSFGEWQEVLAPTIDKKGIEERLCSVCGETERRETEVLPYIIAEGTCGANIRWEFYSDGTLKIYGLGDMLGFFGIGQMKARAMRASATDAIAEFRDEIKKVIVEEGVTSINDSAFAECPNLESVTIADSVSEIGEQVFMDCEKLEKVELPSNISEIKKEVFTGCTSLKSVEIPDSVKVIGDGAFAECKQLDNVKLSESLSEIGESAFTGCKGLTSIVFPESVKYIRNKAFGGCSLEKVYYSGVKDNLNISVGNEALQQAEAVEEHKHDFKEKEVIEKTCTERRRKISECEECHTRKTEYTGEAVGHKLRDSVVEATCEDRGYMLHVCEKCGYSYAEAYAEAKGHVEEVIAAIKPTCTETGRTVGKKCSVCGEVLVAQEAVPALGHTFSEWTVTTTATTENEGVQTRTCTVCGDTETQTIPKLPVIDNPFTDVPIDEWYSTPVLWAVQNGITNGTSDTTFAPAATCTRGQIVTFLWRAAGSPEPTSQGSQFTDIAPDDYYYKAVLWAVENGITNGMTETTFEPGKSCIRAQAVTFLWRYENSTQIEADNPFADVPSGEYYTAAVLWAVDRGITNGTSSTTFAPGESCTRGHIVTFLHRDIVK